MSTVYVMQAVGLPNSPVKIGYTDQDVNERAKQIHSPYELAAIYTMRCGTKHNALRVESMIHQQLSFWRMRGEWFECNHHIKRYLHAFFTTGDPIHAVDQLRATTLFRPTTSRHFLSSPVARQHNRRERA